MDPNLLLLLMFTAITLVVCAGLFLARDLLMGNRATVDQRMADLTKEVSLQRLRTSADETRAATPIARFDQSFERLITETGLDIAPPAALLAHVLVGLLVGGAFYIWREDLLVGIGGFVLGALLMFCYFLYRRSNRQRQIREQLPDVMDLLARAVRAGETLDQAISLAGDASQEPLGTEFRRCSAQLDLGLSMDAAMRSLTRRAPITEIRILAATFMVQRHAGGNLPLTLERLAAVVRDRISYYRQFRAATAAGRISTLLIAAAGPLVAVYMLTFQPDYIRRFVELPMGSTLLTIAIVLQLVGLVWIYRLFKTDY